MFFLLKAVFWLGLVFLLLPDRGLFTSHPRKPERAAPAAVEAAVPGDAAQTVATRALEFCRDNAATCAAGAALVGEAAAAAAAARRDLAAPAPATETARPKPQPALTQDTLTPADLQVPFGGVSVPAGLAPRTAPLPPRRPA
jgi:hypothetical protein